MPDTPQLGWFSERLIEILPAAVYVCDTEAVIVAFNARATELWGRTPQVGQTDEKFCGSHKKRAKAVRKGARAIARAVTSGTKDGGGGPAHGRLGARLQQLASWHLGQP